MDNMFLVVYHKAELLRERQWSKAGYFQLLENVTRVPEVACNAIMNLKFMGNIRTKVLWILWLKVLEKLISAKTPESIIQACCPTVISSGTLSASLQEQPLGSDPSEEALGLSQLCSRSLDRVRFIVTGGGLAVLVHKECHSKSFLIDFVLQTHA